MTLALHHITVDCADALTLATFWSAALDKPLGERGDERFASLGGDASDGQAWLFFQVPEPKTAKNRMHTDLRSDDRAADVDRLVGLGATVVADEDRWGVRWTVLQDPEGNEFCVVQV
jgi:catechol 2,3-dioxygenase-like lactoylglutathione lyase family enzyme